MQYIEKVPGSPDASSGISRKRWVKTLAWFPENGRGCGLVMYQTKRKST
jgi:hypothetical protein